MVRCREAQNLPRQNPDEVERYWIPIGDEEDWQRVLDRAAAVRLVEKDVGRPPWKCVYRVRFADGDRLYLVAE